KTNPSPPSEKLFSLRFRIISKSNAFLSIYPSVTSHTLSASFSLVVVRWHDPSPSKMHSETGIF
ncbi:TPA: hypothetical protein ACP2MU_004775, partial [Escherichia coli]